MDEILSDPACFFTFRFRYPPIIQYFVKHARELVFLALHDTEQPNSYNAFRLLMLGDDAIKDVIIKKDLLSEAVMEVLSNPDPLNSSLSRVSDISLQIFVMPTHEATESCAFLYPLLKYADNLDIFYLFQTILCQSQSLFIAQQKFKQLRFADFLAQELMTLDYTNSDKNDRFNKNFSLAFAYFSFLKTGALNHILRSQFHAPVVIQALLRDEDFPAFVESAKWEAVLEISKICNLDNFIPFIIPAKKLLMKHTEILYPFHVAIIYFLSSVIVFNASFVNDEFLQSILRLMAQFEQSSILHNAIIDFVRLGLKGKKMDEMIASNFVPFLLIEAQQREHGLIAAAAFQIFNLIIPAAKRRKEIKMILNEIDEYEYFASRILPKYNKIAKSNYGGKVENVVIPLSYSAPVLNT